MSRRILYMGMSLDGFITGPNDDKGNPAGDGGMRLQEWLGHGGPEVADYRPTDRQSQIVFDEIMSTGAVITGRRTGDFADYWGGDHHDGVPIFVPTHTTRGAEDDGCQGPAELEAARVYGYDQVVVRDALTAQATPTVPARPCAGPLTRSWPSTLDGNHDKEHSVEDEDGYFGEQTAARYDELSADMFESGAVDPAVEMLAGLAGRGRALELGVGTGRIALPLAARGVPVHGIDLSRAMVARLRDKPGGEAIGVTIGDFATTRVDGTFSLAYLVFNTIMNLTTQEAQVACFATAAAHLEPGGCFVVEVRVPELRRLPAGQNVLPWQVSPERWVLYSYDVATQAMRGHYLEVADGRGQYNTIPFRYVWPAELDLMAQLAGLRLRERWSGWTREPFTSESRQHVSIWEKPLPPDAPRG